MFDRTQFAAFAKERLGLALVSTATLPPQVTPKDPENPTAEEKAGMETYAFAKHHHDLHMGIAVNIELDRCAIMALAAQLDEMGPVDDKITALTLKSAGDATDDLLMKACYYALAFAFDAATKEAQ